MPDRLPQHLVEIRWARALRLLAQGVEVAEVCGRVKLPKSTFYRRLSVAREKHARLSIKIA